MLYSINKNWTLEIQREILFNEHTVVSLSKIQFRILHFLAMNMNRPVSNNDIIKFAWGDEKYATKNTLYVYIYRLRTLIEENEKNRKIYLMLEDMVTSSIKE